MIASCPQCATRFEVDESRLGPSGRKVKCGKCGHLWLQRADGGTAAIPAAPPPPAAAPAEPPAASPIDIPAAPSIIEQSQGSAEDPAAEPADTPAAEEAAPAEAPPAPARQTPRVVPPPKRRSGKRLVAMLLVAIVVLGLFGLGAMALRSGEHGPNTLVASVLGMLGLKGDALNAEGLGFENVSTARRIEGTVQLLVITGDVVNTAATARIIPPLRGALLASDNREVQNWTFAAKAEKVEPGQRVRFETTLKSPSMDATDVKVTFALPGG